VCNITIFPSGLYYLPLSLPKHTHLYVHPTYTHSCITHTLTQTHTLTNHRLHSGAGIPGAGRRCRCCRDPAAAQRGRAAECHSGSTRPTAGAEVVNSSCGCCRDREAACPGCPAGRGTCCKG
jgi:hypothetical protein